MALAFAANELSSTGESKLQGGSFATVTLSRNAANTIVSKIIINPLGDIDADIRLRQEIAYLRSLPHSARTLFPRVLSVVDEPDRVGYTSVFYPYKTIGELLKDREITADVASSLLARIYHRMNRAMYVHTKLPQSRQDDYFVRLDRRMRRIFATPQTHARVLKRLLGSDAVTIDGISCLGYAPVMKILIGSSKLSKLAIPQDNSLCHGDMILEDILYDPPTGDFKLIDPNFVSDSKYYDYAKTFLSLSTYYELFYFGLFSLSVDQNETAISFSDQKFKRTYDTICSSFWNFLETNHHEFFGNDPDWKIRLKLLTGLQNLAIVMFHIIHHNHEERATAFLLMGLKTINEALEELT